MRRNICESDTERERERESYREEAMAAMNVIC